MASFTGFNVSYAICTFSAYRLNIPAHQTVSVDTFYGCIWYVTKKNKSETLILTQCTVYCNVEQKKLLCQLTFFFHRRHFVVHKILGKKAANFAIWKPILFVFNCFWLMWALLTFFPHPRHVSNKKKHVSLNHTLCIFFLFNLSVRKNTKLMIKEDNLFSIIAKWWLHKKWV